MGTTTITSKKTVTISVYHVLSLLFAVFSVLCSVCMWKSLDGWSIPSSILKIILLVIGFLVACWHASLTYKETYSIMILAAYLLIYIIVTQYDVQGYMLTVFTAFLVLFLLTISSIKNHKLGIILLSFENVVFCIALISLVAWLFGSVLHILPGRTTVPFTFSGSTSNAYTYGYLYFENPRQYQNLFGMTIPRNTGVFVEAPSYSSFLIYALLIEMFRNKKNKLYIIVFVLASLTTFSAKSYVFLIEITFLTYMLKPTKHETKKRNVKVVRFIGFVLVAIIAVIGLYYVVKIKSDTRAYSYRVDSALAGLKTWTSHPMFGSGYGNAEEIISNTEMNRRATNVSMGLTSLLGQGGLYLTAFYLYPFIMCRKRLKNTKWETAYIFVTLIALTDLVISRIMYAVYFELIVAIGYTILFLRKEYLQ